MKHATAATAFGSLLLAASAAAYAGTSPLHVRCGHSSSSLSEPRELPKFAAVVKADEAYAQLSKLGCDWDAAMVVFVDGLHSSHLPSALPHLPPTSQSPLLSIPYLTSSPSLYGLRPHLAAWSDACLASAVAEGRDEHLVEVVEVAGIKDLPSHLPRINAFLAAHPSHLLLLTGSPTAPSPDKRQLVDPTPYTPPSAIEHLVDDLQSEWSDSKESEEELVEALMGFVASPSASEDEDDEQVDSYPSEEDDDDSSASYDDSPLSTQTSWSSSLLSDNDDDDSYDDFVLPSRNSTKLLDHAQILSTPVITALLISFLVFLPVLGVGISALAGIQVPPHMMSIGKGMTTGISAQKKDQ